jgi:hypothetical protein
MNTLQTMKNIDREVLFRLIRADKSGTFDLSEKILSSLAYSILKGGSVEDQTRYLIAIPQSTPFHQVALVAHADTCDDEASFPEGREIIEKTGFIRNNKPSVLGADDRAGVYAVLKIVEGCGGPRPIVIITDGEETGSVGAKYIIREDLLRPYINNIALFIQLDRRDYISYNRDMFKYSLPDSRNYVFYCGEPPKQITDMLHGRHYLKKKGRTSDVRHLTDAYNIPHVNMSIGYCNEHTPDEVLSLQLLNDTIDDVRGFLSGWNA